MLQACDPAYQAWEPLQQPRLTFLGSTAPRRSALRRERRSRTRSPSRCNPTAARNGSPSPPPIPVCTHGKPSNTEASLAEGAGLTAQMDRAARQRVSETVRKMVATRPSTRARAAQARRQAGARWGRGGHVSDPEHEPAPGDPLALAWLEQEMTVHELEAIDAMSAQDCRDELQAAGVSPAQAEAVVARMR